MTSAQHPPALEVVEYTDPLCPWSWGAEPVLRLLRTILADRVRWRRVYCVLFDEDDDPAPDPAAETAWYARYVEDITAHTGAPRAAHLTRVAASSWPCSQVAKAAELQGGTVADRVLRRLRETMFVHGEPADTLALALTAARGVPGLDAERLAADAASSDVRERVRADRAEARRPVPEVLSVPGGSPHPGAAKETEDGGRRYALPTLILRTAGAYRVVPGWRSYDAYAAAVGELCPGLPRAPVTLQAEQALEHHRSLTDPERALLTHGPWPPHGAVRVETGNGPLWLHPEEP
ncbi:DsbA family protein [Streptomyces sp. CSMPJR101]|uniref:DsbA family oxidoreductase n=1 Tax=Streptomyces sp. CSMPJR101 TaxID=1279378 RepID=UPI003852C6F4